MDLARRVMLVLCSMLACCLVAGAEESITVRNRTVRKPVDLWVGLYSVGTNNADLLQGPYLIPINGDKKWTKAGDKFGETRWLRWSPNKSDLKSQFSLSDWKSVGGVENKNEAGNGFLTCNISDKDSSGVYIGKTDNGEWISSGWSNLWDSIWGPLSTAGDPCTVYNFSDTTYYVAEYQRPFEGSGDLDYLQGGKDSKWMIPPGGSIKFTKAKLSPGYTWRWIRWIDKPEPAASFASSTFETFKGRKSDYKGVNQIYISYAKNGDIAGYNDVEWLLQGKEEVITVRNRTIEDPQPLYVAEYSCNLTANTCTRVKAPVLIDTAEEAAWTKSENKLDCMRKIRWSTNKDDLKNSFSLADWNKVGGHVGTAHIGLGFLTANISDKGAKGQYTSKTDTGEWVAATWEATWDTVWGPLSTAGTQLVVLNETPDPIWVAEYQEKPWGKVQKLSGQGPWPVAAGATKTFTRAKLSPGYTERNIHWASSNASSEFPGEYDPHQKWSELKARNNCGFGINQVHVYFDKDGNPKGYTDLEWTLKELINCKLLMMIMNELQDVNVTISIPPAISKAIGLDAAMAEMDKQIKAASEKLKLDEVAALAAEQLESQLSATGVAEVKKAVGNLNSKWAAAKELFKPDCFCSGDPKKTWAKIKELGLVMKPGWASTSSSVHYMLLPGLGQPGPGWAPTSPGINYMLLPGSGEAIPVGPADPLGPAGSYWQGFALNTSATIASKGVTLGFAYIYGGPGPDVDMGAYMSLGFTGGVIPTKTAGISSGPAYLMYPNAVESDFPGFGWSFGVSGGPAEGKYAMLGGAFDVMVPFDFSKALGFSLSGAGSLGVGTPPSAKGVAAQVNVGLGKSWRFWQATMP